MSWSWEEACQACAWHAVYASQGRGWSKPESAAAARFRLRRRSALDVQLARLARAAAIDRRLDRYPGPFLSAAGFRGVGLPDGIGDARQVARRAIRHVNGRA